MGVLRRIFGSAGEKGGPPLFGDAPFEIEYCASIRSGPCECCGGMTTTLNRLVKRGGAPFAMCRITFGDRHFEEPARAIFGVGQFGEGTHPHQRVAFGVSLKPEGIMIIDAARAEWDGLEILGPRLTREQALEHPMKSEVFRLVDQLYAQDSALNQYFNTVVARAEPSAPPNGGPAERLGNLGVGGVPPSVS